jgi:hypothetical protein
MQQTGYSLIDKDNNIIESWYENAGSRSKPDEIVLPNGDILAAPELYVENSGGYKLVKRFLVNEPPSEWYRHISSSVEFNGTDVVETYVFSETPNVVPQFVTPLQFRRALNQLDIRDDVETYVNTLSQDEKDAWEYATEFQRNNQIIANAAIALNKTSEEVDDLFRLASTL